MKCFILLPLILALGGCVSADAIRGGIAQRGAAISDQVVSDAEFAMCKGVTVGAIVRKYGNSQELWDAWSKLCGYSGRDLPRPVAE